MSGVGAHDAMQDPHVIPRDAGTLIVVDRSQPAPKVLLGLRHASHVFMPGKYVFPGGRMENYDCTMPVAASLHPLVESLLLQSTTGNSRSMASGIALAAIRETFEETGFLLGAKREDSPPVPDGPWASFVRSGFYPDLSVLHFITRAITPPGFPRRFDARFFAVDLEAVAHIVEDVVHADAELTELHWVTISQARKFDLPMITNIVLSELEDRAAKAMSRDLPVPFYRMQNGHFQRELLSA